MNVLSSGSALKPGDALTSQNGRYRFELQSDGNLVLTGPTGLAWDSDTRGEGAATAEMQADGNFVLYTADRAVVWTAETTGPGAHLVLQDDRNIVIWPRTAPRCCGRRTATSPRPSGPRRSRRRRQEGRRRGGGRCRRPAPAPAATPAPQTYTVQRGDTLSAIAKRFYGHAASTGASPRPTTSRTRT